MDLQIQQHEERSGIFLMDPQCFETKGSNGSPKLMLISKNLLLPK